MADYWTIQTLNNADGINRYHEQTVFTFPTGQNGADSGGYIFQTGASTLPTFATQACYYTLQRDGKMSLAINLTNNAGGTAGSGADILYFAIPASSKISTDYSVASMNMNGYYRNGGTWLGLIAEASGVAMLLRIATAAQALLNPGSFSDTDDRRVRVVIDYKAF